MRLFATGILLSIGLIATTTARSINSDEQDDESSFSKQDLQQILGDIQTTCYNHTGSNATYESIVSHIYAIPVCVMMNWDVQNFIEDVENLNSFTRYWFFPKYCPQVRSALQCIETPLRELRKCLDEDDAAIFFTNYIEQCNGTISNETDAMKMAKYGPTQCDEIVNFRKCMKEKMDHCGGPRLMDVFDVLYRAFARASPCNNFIILPGQKDDHTLDEEENEIRHF
ncbi:AAEL003482-PA [Aedes aegypti]|uniref:AAEL003482-PA n=1 Tax=Aedes aegypti TaxID=7159 RepID=Q17FA0_AEDAE|nr:AAEL003482-PA [Aedes aegypti]